MLRLTLAALCAALLALRCCCRRRRSAAGNPPGQPAPISAPPGVATLAPFDDQHRRPPAIRLTGKQVPGDGQDEPDLIEELKKHPHLVAYVYTRGSGVWQVS